MAMLDGLVPDLPRELQEPLEKRRVWYVDCVPQVPVVLSSRTKALHSLGVQIHIETSGSSPLSGELDWITLSPKRFKKPTEEIFEFVDELKVVVLTNKDLAWAEENAAKCPEGTTLLLQPEWDTPKSIPLIVDYVKEHPEWGISLQTHKFLKVP